MPLTERKEFDLFLHKLAGNLPGDDWKHPSAKEELDDDEDFYLVEYFGAPAGPLVAAHLNDLDSVLVVVNGEPE